MFCGNEEVVQHGGIGASADRYRARCHRGLRAGQQRGESARLQRRADELAADGAALPAPGGLPPGASAVDSRRGPGFFRRGGLADVGTEARVQMSPPGNSRRMIRLDLVRSMRPQVLCWRWDWPAKQNCMNWTPLPAPTSMTALRSWCPAFSS